MAKKKSLQHRQALKWKYGSRSRNGRRTSAYGFYVRTENRRYRRHEQDILFKVMSGDLGAAEKIEHPPRHSAAWLYW